MEQKEEEIRKSFGKRLKIARKNIKYTQEELAEKSSLTSRFISQIERGISFGSATTLVNICNALHISPNVLFDDYIKSDTVKSAESAENKFLKEYSQLNDNNKNTIHIVTDALLKDQLKCDDINNKLKASL